MEDWLSELEKLAKLKEDGILSEAEFNAAKEIIFEKRNQAAENHKQSPSVDQLTPTPASDTVSTSYYPHLKPFKELDTERTPTTLNRNQAVPGQGLAIIAHVLALLSLGFLPILFGPVGVLLGSLSWREGNRYGMYATISAIVCSYLGMIFGVLVWSAV